MNDEEKLQGFIPERPNVVRPETETTQEVSPEQNEVQPTNKETPKPAEESGKFKLPKFKKAPGRIPAYSDPQIARIEKIMENGLGDAYSRLSPIAKQEFKIKGEQTAYQISELLKATHVKVKKILKLILEWLRLLPGVNRFFLEQEAKIKTDEILSLRK